MSTKKTDETAVAVLDPSPAALATYAPSDTRGKESFEAGDYDIPQLKIAQKTSKEIEKGHAKFLKGLEMGDLFNSLTGEQFGTGPLPFVVIRHNKSAAIFDKKTFKLVERVALDDPRCFFTETADGTSTKPVATVSHNYAIMNPETLDLFMLRLKSTQTKAAKKLNGVLKLLKGPIWSATFEVRTAIEQFDGGAAGVFVITQVGKTPADVAAVAEQYYEQTADMATKVAAADEHEAETPDPDDVPF